MDLGLEDARGKQVGLADFRGRAILLNVWATWCAPCRTEMPSLDRLQASLGGDRFTVIALSLDRAGTEAVRPFLAETGVERLDIYVGRPAEIMRRAGILGLPTTLPIDGEGRELRRWAGPRERDSQESTEELRGYLGDGAFSSPATPRQ